MLLLCAPLSYTQPTPNTADILAYTACSWQKQTLCNNPVHEETPQLHMHVQLLRVGCGKLCYSSTTAADERVLYGLGR
jgi:hypothetical protein